MERPVLRAAARSRVVAPSLNLVRFHQPRRLLSTAPPSQKSRSWKNTALRWGIAIGGVYFYNTSNLFAADSAYAASKQIVEERDGSEDQTLEDLLAKRRQISSNSEAKGPPSPAVAELEQGQGPDESPQTLEEYEDEADSQGAFNPETGEINWDCPCLGGMAHGPCGPEFRAAFSCFVYSNEEPKGMDCIEKFKGMQDCFRQHPDIYGEELNEEEEEQDRQRIESEARTDTSPSAPSSGEKVAYSGPAQTKDLTEEDAAKRSRAKGAADKM